MLHIGQSNSGRTRVRGSDNRLEVVAPENGICMTRVRTRARGDERLSAKRRSQEGGHSGRARDPATPDRKSRKARSADLGRALRSIYDDTLRETVPDDFLDLIGKLR